MKLLRSWPLYVVLAVIFGYLVFSEDESPKEGKGSSDEVVESPGQSPPKVMPEPSVWQEQPPYKTFGTPSSASRTYPGSDYPTDPARSNLYRFRPVGPTHQSQDQYQPSYGLSERQDLYDPMPGQQRYDPGVQQYPVPGQGDMGYRFRPVDPARQSRRWSGNYPNPYSRGNYYAPQSRPDPPVGSDSLWAESASKR